MTKNHQKTIALTAALAACTFWAGCAMVPTSAQVQETTRQVLKSPFREQGIAKLDRLQLDASNQACSDSEGASLNDKLDKAIEEKNLKTVKFSTDGKLLGVTGLRVKKFPKTLAA